MSQTLILKNQKIVKSGDQYFFAISKKLVDAGVVSRDKRYKVIIKEEGGDG